MAVDVLYTSGTSATNYQPFITGAGQISTQFYPASWSGATSPNGNKYFLITRIQGKAKGYDGTSNVSMFIGTSSTSGSTNTGTVSCSTSAYSSTGDYVDRVVVGGTTYYAGYDTNSAGGLYTTRSTGESSSYSVYQSGSAGFTSSQAYYVLTYTSTPSTSGTLTLSDATKDTIYYTPPAYSSGSDNTLVQWSTDPNFGSIAGSDEYGSGGVIAPATGLAADTTYYFRHSSNVLSMYLSNNNATGPWGTTVSLKTLPAGDPPGDISSGFGSGTTNVAYSGYAYSAFATSMTASGLPSWASGTATTQSGAYFYVTGTPTSPGTYTFNVSSSNDYGTKGPTQFSITVSNPPAASWNGNNFTTPWVQNTSGYNSTISFANASSITYSGSIPPGLTASTYTSGSTCYFNLTGTPNTQGSYSITNIVGTGTGGSSSPVSQTIVISQAPPVFTDSSVSSTARVAVAYSDAVVATGASSYALASGSLPNGLSLNTSTGVISGTPATGTEGTYNFTVSATNAGGTVTTGSLQIVVSPPPTAQAYLYDGTSWSLKTAKIYNGTSWGPGIVWKYNGTSWTKLTL